MFKLYLQVEIEKAFNKDLNSFEITLRNDQNNQDIEKVIKDIEWRLVLTEEGKYEFVKQKDVSNYKYPTPHYNAVLTRLLSTWKF